ncbi:hypothetical protein OU995_25935 [Roseateles sp. SL47]|uniref:hypothetical protein n=1 Tax=Roseateles sp. SL47 TaxID=2995138 RepID=UPI0022700526|nr:hypothetical protein [Roseateles sp. SL47]WAC72912.1 hypothetical protein OU995_25935 [Roseateles sp. SL47]
MAQHLRAFVELLLGDQARAEAEAIVPVRSRQIQRQFEPVDHMDFHLRAPALAVPGFGGGPFVPADERLQQCVHPLHQQIVKFPVEPPGRLIELQRGFLECGTAGPAAAELAGQFA